MKKLNTDICVVGGGAGGLGFAAGAVQMGARVVVVEKGKMGGDCLNYGCVPSKAMLTAAQLAFDMRRADKFGLPKTDLKITLAHVHAHIDSVIKRIAPHDSVERFEALGCTVVAGSAHFIARRTLLAGTTQIRAKYFVLATGSQPFIPPIDGLKNVPFFTNETIFNHQETISHLIVVGGGPIGLELAQAHQRLGVKTSVIERGALLAHEDPDLGKMLIDNLKREGIAFHTMCDVASVEGKAGNLQVNLLANNGERIAVKGSHLLIATGRVPNLEGLNLETAGVEASRRGVVVDDRLRTKNRRIYAIGDCAGGAQFTHVAGYHAGIAIRNILFGMRARSSLHNLPLVTYSDPELASLGLSERQAREKHGAKVKTLVFDFDENDRAHTAHNTQGRIKAFTYKGKILGVTILGAHAGDLLAPWIIAREAGLSISQIASPIMPYPTLSEISKRVAGQAFTPMLFSSRTRKIVRFFLALRS